ncbi:diguanylate cyclase (GGDEF) domain-containing protein [Thermodesulfovibrio aggregans]|uniref:diguanylate cyclase n=1 Tax=Thermodesulfovibrio aggregans TaxID=86166 RepID=A0A0U9HVR9_9BACT|nr:GGDEF domain-containing protein [Thermodesulfovibrio aggregans]GAQ94797.1 diguanylate cyclase (GGDEF) domain-containing protein [Thermodesulfovibrio aggregans]
MTKKIIVIVKSPEIKKVIKKILLDSSYEIYYFEEIREALDIIYDEVPDLVLIEAVNNPFVEVSIINDLKSDPLFVSMNVLAIVSPDFYTEDWQNFIVDDYVRVNELQIDLPMRINLCFERLERVIATSPLTKLPGNLVIQREIQKRLQRGDVFALAYADLDNFKPFNDKYGFSRGDQVIKMLGRLILNIIRSEQPNGSFVGHIGGDDFVYIMSPEKIEETTQKIINIFDNLVINFYDEEDIRKGYIESVDREGKTHLYPIMTVSVGITSNQFRTFKHFSEMAEVASMMKSVAKKQKEKRYAIDRRRK